jgi:hypothetical protein
MATFVEFQDAATKKPIWINPDLVREVKETVPAGTNQTDIIWNDNEKTSVLGALADTVKKLKGKGKTTAGAIP